MADEFRQLSDTACMTAELRAPDAVSVNCLRPGGGKQRRRRRRRSVGREMSNDCRVIYRRRRRLGA